MKKILLADDDSSVRNALGQLFELEHYEVIQAASGSEAVAKFNANPPDLVLLDLGLPDRNGWEVFDSMQVTHPGVPVLIITAKSHQYRRAADLQVDAIMEKPLDIPVLLEAIRNYLTESAASDSPARKRSQIKTIFLGHPEIKTS